MSVTMLARPSQTLRRRDTTRPTLSTKRGLESDSNIEVANKKRRLEEPYVRTSQYILNKHKGKSPSLVIHLHTKHFRFEGQDGSYTYDGPMRVLIKHLKAQTVPHDLLEELLLSGVQFYDGCLIVEVHNHRNIESNGVGNTATEKADDTKKLSVHNWNAHITPSPFVPYPHEAQESDVVVPKDEEGDKRLDGVKTKPPSKEGPKITTLVLHPTEQTKHEELLILAKTPLSDFKKRKSADGLPAATPSTTVPPTPTSANARSNTAASQKMALEQSDLYNIQGEILLATEPPLYLEPAEDAENADAVLKMLEHPLHSGKPPEPRERKRTTAQMAADDAQAAETERRMLIFDERLGPLARPGVGAGSSDNQNAAALGFSRFKTIDMVRQKQAEAERLKKEEDARQQQEKRLQEEQQLQAQKMLAAQKKAQEVNLQQEQVRRRMLMQQHQQQEAMKLNGQQMMANHLQNAAAQNVSNFNAVAASQASPIVNQLTPLMAHSSPMVSQNGFSMMPNQSQGAGSPPRPPSAAIPNGVNMTRGPSQQTHASLNNTPLINQGGTPSLANAVPNRAMSQTPRLGPSSPMAGTPAANMTYLPRVINGNLDTSQDIMMQQMQNAQQANLMAGQNPQQNAANPTMNPENVQFARRMAKFSELSTQFQQQARIATSQGNTPLAQQFLTNAKQAQASYAAMRQKLLGSGHVQAQHVGQNGANALALQAQQNGMLSQNNLAQQQQLQNQNQNQLNAASMTPQQQQVLAARQQAARVQQQMAIANQQLNTIAQNHGGNIPDSVVAGLPPLLQSALRQRRAQQVMQAQQAQQAQNMVQNHGMQMNNQGSLQNGAQSYMQNLRALQMQNAAQQQASQGGTNRMTNMPMGMNPQQMQQYVQAQRQQAMRQQQQQQQQQGGDLSQSFADMQAALQRGHGQ